MLRITVILALCITSLTSFANTISFCVNDDDIQRKHKTFYFALDGEVFIASYPGSNCFDHDTRGTSLVLFTNGFDVTYQSAKCGNVDPCVIPLKLAEGRALASFIIESKVLLPHYAKTE